MPRCADPRCGRWRPALRAPQWMAGIRMNDAWYCSRACVETAAREGLDGRAKPAAQHPSDRIDVILDIDLPLVVRFGRTELPLKSVTRLGPGSLIDLGRTPDEPVEILVSNQVVARGEVVIVSGSYGVRILEVVSARDRLRSMEV